MKRPSYLKLIDRYFKAHPIVAILGPRQCGKTTLGKMYIDLQESFEEKNYFDLENPTDLERLKQPKLTFANLSGLLIIDEIQRIPTLFPLLRFIVDENKNNRKFLILGSVSKEIIQVIGLKIFLERTSLQ